MAHAQHDVALGILMRTDFSRRSVLEHSAAQWLLEERGSGRYGTPLDAAACSAFLQYAAKDEVVAAIIPSSCRASRIQQWASPTAVAIILMAAGCFVGYSRRRAAGAVSPSEQPESCEHAQLFAFFGLPPEASLKEIKAAYRAAIKAIHPDRNPEAQQEAASEEFIEATQCYEKLLRLRSGSASVGSERKPPGERA